MTPTRRATRRDAVLGHGQLDDLRDIVVVDSAPIRPRATRNRGDQPPERGVVAPAGLPARRRRTARIDEPTLSVPVV
jgi:hypothetical protein